MKKLYIHRYNCGYKSFRQKCTLVYSVYVYFSKCIIYSIYVISLFMVDCEREKGRRAIHRRLLNYIKVVINCTEVGIRLVVVDYHGMLSGTHANKNII